MLDIHQQSVSLKAAASIVQNLLTHFFLVVHGFGVSKKSKSIK